jgi:hypothetical protein
MPPTEPPTNTKAFALGNSAFAEVQVVRDFINDHVRPITDRHDTNSERLYHGILLRLSSWFWSLSRLNHPGDYQAVTAGTRAIFEMTIDLILLAHDPDNPLAKYAAWERSAKVHGAERLAKHFQKNNGGQPSESQRSVIAWAKKVHATTTAERLLHWPHYKGKHPSNRWTGRRLDRDAEIADLYEPGKYAEYYALHFAALCWNVHGTGLMGVRGLSAEDFPALVAIAFRECCDLATTASGLVLKLVGQFDAISEQRLAHFVKEREVARVQGFVSQKSKHR